MSFYAIYGSGSCGENIIEDGLADIGVEGNEFMVVFRKGASSSEDRVLDYLIDNEAKFSIVVDGKAPRVLEDAASFVNTLPSNKHAEAIFQRLKQSDGTLLILWDDEREQELTELAFKALDAGIPVKELSNGLAPMTAEEPEEEAPNMEPFTLDELKSMSIGVLRKAATARGIEGVGAYEKDELIALLAEGYAPKTRSTTTTTSTSTNATVTWNMTTPVLPHSTPTDYAVIVWHENGAMQMAQVPVEKVKPLFG